MSSSFSYYESVFTNYGVNRNQLLDELKVLVDSCPLGYYPYPFITLVVKRRYGTGNDEVSFLEIGNSEKLHRWVQAQARSVPLSPVHIPVAALTLMTVNS